ncbi:PIN domain-containing protein [Streptomyces sp. CB02261]|uniref:PIN domain-containing protein n=1 Tax=Streptomyces sp. CB02261 TaxID=1703940 RepID=UPI00093BEEA8|nr:PIN domain-containing protein [Streptomyces sp. CB02261]OKJ68320.1 PIN family toxin-antitoxin system, toxin component [Streptomyces sp. CB02261]
MKHYLADTSAVWRLLRRQIGEPWPGHVAHGRVSLCPPVEAELMRGLRADRDHEPFTTMLNQTFAWVPAPEDPWPKVVAVQRDLLRIGHLRGPSPMDILIALTAEQHRQTLLHVDDDFTAIAKVRPGIEMVRLVPEA